MAQTIGYGVTLSVSTSTGDLNIANVRSIDGPGATADAVDVTTLDSTGYFREFLGGLIDPGELTAELVWDTSNVTFNQIIDRFYSRAAANWTLTYTTSNALDTFSAIVNGISQAIPLDDAVTRTVTFKITKKPFST